MPTSNEPGTVYPPSPVFEHPVREWSQDDLDDFRAGWETLTEERKKFSRDQPVLYARTPEGLLNIRTAEIVEKTEPAKPPVPKIEHPDPSIREQIRAEVIAGNKDADDELVKRSADRAKKTRA